MKKYLELFKNYSLKVIVVAGLKEIYRKTWKETVKGSYAQNYEDLIIENLFDENYIGKYLEIGAYHPSRLSNTYRLYKKGWRGIVVEPNPEVKNIFSKIRPGDKFLNIGISDKNQTLDYYQFLIPALNTFSKIEVDKNIKKGHKLENVVKIKTEKIDEIIDEKIDFLSIDTEGFDEMILENWLWKKRKPRVICVEGKTKKVILLLADQGYLLYKKTKYNSIFLKN
jgi:FkbM family methyltransferase